jgi:hypothetical protein
MELKRLIKVLTPFAKAIACLESSQSNPADVYLFWLAILASLKRLFDDDTAGFSVSEAGQIRAIANARFRELLQEGPDDCYISAFYLDPRTLFRPNPYLCQQLMTFDYCGRICP